MPRLLSIAKLSFDISLNLLIDTNIQIRQERYMLMKNEFDYIFDRGCFHVLSPGDRKEYTNKIKRILKDNGILFLKCFSDKEPRQEGPYKFSQNEISDFFNESFRIDSIKETVYQGTLDPLPKALFFVMISQSIG